MINDSTLADINETFYLIFKAQLFHQQGKTVQQTCVQTPYDFLEQSHLILERLPDALLGRNYADKNLQAWNAADEYLLSHVDSTQKITATTDILIVNDDFGLLTLSLNAYQPMVWSDSYLAKISMHHNAELNDLTPQWTFVKSVDVPRPQGECFDVVLIKIPKTLALLEAQLSVLSTQVNSETLIVAAGMVKHLPKTVYALFERYIGTTKTSLTQKKARLIFANSDGAEERKQGVDALSIEPFITAESFDEPWTGLRLFNHANVFKSGALDIGSRFFLTQFPALFERKKIAHGAAVVDLGCGNGVLGIMVQKYVPSAALIFVDESYMAVESARLSYTDYVKKIPSIEGKAEFLVGDCLTTFMNSTISETTEVGQSTPKDVDVIVCNPPFHQQHSVGDGIAWRMFGQSAQLLTEGGELWVVGNRHLNYHAKLKKIFGNCTVFASNKKFVVLCAVKRAKPAKQTAPKTAVKKPALKKLSLEQSED